MVESEGKEGIGGRVGRVGGGEGENICTDDLSQGPS